MSLRLQLQLQRPSLSQNLRRRHRQLQNLNQPPLQNRIAADNLPVSLGEKRQPRLPFFIPGGIYPQMIEALNRQ